MSSRRSTRLLISMCLSAVVLGLTIAAVLPAQAARLAAVDTYSLAHLTEPNRYICDYEAQSHPYRSPLDPRADQSVTIRARGAAGNLTGVVVWYTTDINAYTITQWSSVPASVDGHWDDCEGNFGWSVDSWAAVIPAQSSRVWYQIAYTDDTETLWQREPGEGGEDGDGVFDFEDWEAIQTQLIYAPPDVVLVDDDFGPGDTGWDRIRFASIQNSVSAVAAGGTVNIYSGFYTESIIINNPLILAGVDPADTITVRPVISNANCTGGSLCNGAASNLILVQADDVTISGLTLDGNNPLLGSGIAARNGIIHDNLAGGFNNLIVHDTTIRNVFLHGIYPYDGSFHIHDNLVENVQGDASSIAVFSVAGSGMIERNTVNAASQAIAADQSRGIRFSRNIVTGSGGGVHTGNNGGSGSAADFVEWNTVSSCSAGGYGVRLLAPAHAIVVENNTVTGCAVGLALAGQSAPVAPIFRYNQVDGQALPGSRGIYVTTNQLGAGSSNVSASFSYNAIAHTAIGIDLEQEAGYQLTAAFTDHSLSNNTTGLEMTGGSVTFAGNNVDAGATAVVQSGGTLLAYANNFTNYLTPIDRSAGTAQLAHNWWGDAFVQPDDVSAPDWQARLGAPIVELGGFVVWNAGDGRAELSTTADVTATLNGGTGIAVIVDHGDSLPNAPFGNAIYDSDSMCSNYYDFFTVGGSGTWAVSVPVHDPPECNTQTLDPGRIYWIPASTNYSVECTPSNNTACWDPITTNVITGGQNITVTGLSVTDLGGTQFVAGSIFGSDPTAIAIVGFAATTDRSVAPAGIILAGAVIVATGLVLVTRRRR